MKRIIMVTRSIMALITCVFYSARVKEKDRSIRMILIWGNPTPYKIPVGMFKSYFDEIYAVPPVLGGWLMPSPESVRRELEYKRWLDSSGLTKKLKESCEREILLTDVDNNGLVQNIFRIMAGKRNPHKMVLFEEGLALYNEDKRTVKEIVEYNLGKKRVYLPILGQSRRIDTIIAQWPENVPKWKRKNRTVVLQSDVFSDGRLLSDMVLQDKNLRKMKDALEGKKILLYLGSPCSELDQSFRMKKEIALLEDIISVLPEDYLILIKGHPRESKNKYKRFEGYSKCVVFSINTTWYPIEFLLPLFQIKVAVTCASSSAINIAERIPECRAVYTYKYMGVRIPDAWVAMFDNPAGGIFAPGTKEELRKAIASEDVEDKMTFQEKKNGRDVAYMVGYLNGK